MKHNADFAEVDREFFYDGVLGTEYTPEKTVFRLWAPLAESAELRLYDNGSTGAPLRTAEMEQVSGVWSVEICGDLHGRYYTYAVTHGGITRESTDIYAQSAGANGKRGMVLDYGRTNPDGWENTAPVRLSSNADAVIYELHVRDFSMDGSGGFINRGKYAAFCENGVTNRFGDRIGLEYIAELGVTHIHLLPVFDFASVDEESAEPQYNWGYDPLNMNVPEGSYSTNPQDGAVRVRELKELIMAAHSRGLGIIMDVVYNHTFSAEDSPFNRLFPDYYFRHDESGAYSNGSGCGNEFASERAMAGKFICDSLCRWAEEYKLDGFRFDLMGLLDIDTMNRCAAALRRINPDILLYGEGWTGGISPLPDDRKSLKCNARRLDGIAMFSDDFRDGVKGSVFNDRDRGYVNGSPNREELIKSVLCGGISHPEVKRDERELWTENPLQTVNYVECHDNLTLYDKLCLSMPRAGTAKLKAADKMAAALVFFAQGIPFIQAGQELLRSKLTGGGFDHNSYKSPDSVNSIKWNAVTENRDILEYYRGLIAIRKAYPELRRRTAADIRENLHFEDLGGGALAMHSGALTLVLNPLDKPLRYPAAEYSEVLADGEKACAEGIRKAAETERVQPRSILLIKRTGA